MYKRNISPLGQIFGEKKISPANMYFIQGMNFSHVKPWYFYKIVTQNTLRRHAACIIVLVRIKDKEKWLYNSLTLKNIVMI